MSKRGENIRKRKDGRWEARLLTNTGKYKSFYAYSYSEVKEKLRTSQEIQQKPKEIKPFNISFEELSKEWLSEKEIKDKQSTVAIYKGIINRHLMPYFKNINVSKIEKEQINQFVKFKNNQNSLSAKTLHDVTAVLLQILKYAQKQGYIAPLLYDITLPKAVKKELQILTPQEQAILVNSIKHNVSYENIGILLSLYTGLRLGEICALQWNDIDLKNGIVSITKTMQRISVQGEEQKTKVIVDTPKSQQSLRKIPLPDFLIFELKRLYVSCMPEAYILTGSMNKYIEPRAYQYKFKRILKDTGIRDINYHALRHTFATRAVEQYIDPKTVSELLGHSTVKFTLDKYVHPSITLKKESIEKLAVCY